MQSKFIRSLALTPLAFCGAAHAHPSHTSGVLAGLIHPFLGLDHLLAMLAVGVWAAQLGGHAKWLLPASFVALLALGGTMGMAGVALPMVESGIATSVLLLGLLIAFTVKLPPVSGAVMVGVFGVFHGYAHGTEIPMMSTAWQYSLGFVVSSAALHAVGVRLGRGMRQDGLWLRAVGILVALGGVWISATV